MGIPKEGEFVTIQSYKHDGHLHRTWRDTMVLKTSEYSLIGVIVLYSVRSVQCQHP